ncbi:Xanthine and CO dehydrogenases maturation factor [Klebsiella grimontii]|uniref:Xanthine and CO dehydrogenases maturation factor n=1 Tax=Klebsiella grimontii TaxID=2058152 RepID=A0A7H4P1S9_9ENTR|nr:Xanthine and CO dehydrogenases maturation factor [Klebsiella grimontii]
MPQASVPTLSPLRRAGARRSFTDVVEAMAVRPQDFVLIATNNQDWEALDRLITQPVAWLGLLASRRKVQAFVRQLRENGVPEADISRLRAPDWLRHRRRDAQTRSPSACWRRSCR